MASLDKVFNVFLLLNAFLDCVIDVLMVLAKFPQVPFPNICVDGMRRLLEVAILLDLIEKVGPSGVEGSEVTFENPVVISPAIL